jgi:hypothetical protein
MTAKRNCPAVLVSGRMVNTLRAGECQLSIDADTGKPHGVYFGCPCGCGTQGLLLFKGCGHGYAEWSVSGEWPKVTMSPSIGHRGHHMGWCWHGFLRDGMFEEC